MERRYFSWSTYAPLGAVSGPDVPEDELPPRPELADISRLGRRAMRGVIRAARADSRPTVGGRLREHLGPAAALQVVEEAWRRYDHVNVQAGLDAWLAEPGRTHELIGLTGYQHREFGLAELISTGEGRGHWGIDIGNVARINQACGPDEVRPCVLCGIYLVMEGDRRTAILLRGADFQGMGQGVTLQVVSNEPEAAAEVASSVRRLALVHNVYRGEVLTFGGDVFEPGQSLLHFHRRPVLDASSLVLPDGVLESIERQVVEVGRQRARLLASGQHLKRGLLLYGPPGTGKTHTVRYLLGRSAGTTVVQLSGGALHLIAEACSVARALQPAMVIVEDVDLIAEDRGDYPGQHPMLFQLLNEMDGLAEDADVVFILTTNRADLLEPALAARPGRVDHAVELGLPDADARRRLLELYRGRLEIDDEHLAAVAERTDGVTASFLKELLRRAAVLAAQSAGDDEAKPLALAGPQLHSALDELLDTRNAMTRVLLGHGTARVPHAADGDVRPRGGWYSSPTPTTHP